MSDIPTMLALQQPQGVSCPQSSPVYSPPVFTPNFGPPGYFQSLCPLHNMCDSNSSSKERLTPNWPIINETVVAQALETARDTEEGPIDAEVCRILDDAIANIWGKIQAQPDSYVMTTTEMSLFTYFQHSFDGNQVAVEARKRYWDDRLGPKEVSKENMV
jgi:hypothetical protein